MTFYLLWWLMKFFQKGSPLTLLHSERPKLFTILAFLVKNFGLSECSRVKGKNLLLEEQIFSIKVDPGK